MGLGNFAALCIRACARITGRSRAIMNRIASIAASTVRPIGPMLFEFLASCLIFVAAALAGFLILLGLFALGVASSVDILFYRGVLLCIFAFVLTIVLVAWIGRRGGRLSLRDAVAAGFLSLGLNLSML